MLVIQVVIMIMVAITATALVLTRDPVSQTVGLSFYGILLALMFFIYQAPDVALSQIVIGAVALPLMFMLALTKVRINSEIAERKSQKEARKRKEKAA